MAPGGPNFRFVRSREVPDGRQLLPEDLQRRGAVLARHSEDDVVQVGKEQDRPRVVLPNEILNPGPVLFLVIKKRGNTLLDIATHHILHWRTIKSNELFQHPVGQNGFVPLTFLLGDDLQQD